MTQSSANTKGPANSVSLQAAMPVLVFIGVNRLGGLRWAVVAATIWSVKVTIDRRRTGQSLGIFMPVVTAAVIIRGIIGVITGSETVYFGLGIATKYGVATALLLSVALARPLAAMAAPYVLALTPAIISHPAFRSAMTIITAIGALYYYASASLDIWLFQRTSVEGFVLIRFLASWPLAAVALGSAAAVLRRKFDQIPSAGSLTTLIEGRMGQHSTGPAAPGPHKSTGQPRQRDEGS